MTEVVRRASDVGIDYLTVYAFSTENWKRSVVEVSGIFKLLVKYVDLRLQELYENNVVVNVIGDYKPLPKDAIAALERTFARTAANTGLRFNIALNYGSRDEIARAARALAEDAAAGRVDPGAISERDVEDRLWTRGMPDPDLVIRTSGEMRLSNFLLWQSAYSEFVFTDALWPDFTPAEFDRCIEVYRGRNRRYGGAEETRAKAEEVGKSA
jgi:undecaprenyl diphosphate synthase